MEDKEYDFKIKDLAMNILFTLYRRPPSSDNKELMSAPEFINKLLSGMTIKLSPETDLKKATKKLNSLNHWLIETSQLALENLVDCELAEEKGAYYSQGRRYTMYRITSKGWSYMYSLKNEFYKFHFL